MVIKGYSDADWNGVTDSNLSATGWVVYLGDVPVNWCFKNTKSAQVEVMPNLSSLHCLQ